MDKAIEDEKGIKVRIAPYGNAWQLRLRIHSARRIDRLENAKSYDKDHPMHGCSAYDGLQIRLERIEGEDAAWMIVEKLETKVFEVESLNKGEG